MWTSTWTAGDAIPWPSTWTKESVSSAMGMISIACWVVAQAPQFWENYVSQSCQGLALPFLINWLAGDITNLVGCILTDQKEFQTLLAAYFCLIDLVLTAQYVYYSRPRPTSNPPDLGSTDLTSSSNLRPSSLPRSRSDQRLLHSPSARESFTEAALEVALAAERVERSRSRRRYGSESQSRSRAAPPSSTERSSKLYDSYLSEHPPTDPSGSGFGFRSSSSTRDVSQASSPRLTIKGKGALGLSTSPSVTFGQDDRDRGRHGSDSHGQGQGEGRPSRARSSSRSRSRIRGQEKPARPPGQTAAGVVFMGVWALAGLNWRMGASSPDEGVRTVSREGTVVSPRWTGELETRPNYATPSGSRGDDILELYFTPSSVATAAPPDDMPPGTGEPDHPTHKRWDKAAVQRLIGRMSAWICTTLYLTSRLPQIWKNYQRKSVEGLSILLFVFAFCGNVTYVLSIVLNPTGSDGESNPEMVGYYLLEALPYLLGSGGTLIFDLTIMIQSLVYGSAPPIDERDQEDYIEPHHHHHRSQSSRRHSKRIVDEESRPLIERPDEE